MNKQSLETVGKSYIGQFCQSNILTEIGDKGQKKISSAQKITGYEIVTSCGEPELMLCVGGDMVYESTCFNFSNPVSTEDVLTDTERRVITSLHMQGFMGPMGNMKQKDRLKLLQSLTTRGYLDEKTGLPTTKGIEAAAPKWD